MYTWRIFGEFIDHICPPLCASCNVKLQGSRNKDHFAEQFCHSCKNLISKVNALRCSICTEELKKRFGLCPACLTLRDKIPFFCTKTIWGHSEAILNAIKNFKYNKNMKLGRSLAREVLFYLPIIWNESKHLPWDAIVPLPSTKKDIKNRGFLHTYILAEEIKNRLALPILTNSLKVTDEKNRQAHIQDWDLRRKNALFSFFCDPKLVHKKSILLIDDIATTGSSILSASSSLQKAGAKNVDCIVLTTTDKFPGTMRETIMGLSKNRPINADVEDVCPALVTGRPTRPSCFRK